MNKGHSGKLEKYTKQVFSFNEYITCFERFFYANECMVSAGPMNSIALYVIVIS